MNNLNYISVIIPCRNENKHITSVLDSILKQDYDQNKLEILVIDGESDDNTQSVVLEYGNHNSNIILINNEHKTVPYALNLGIKKAKGDIIIRMDAHAIYPNNYISYLVRKLNELNADNVGGIIETLPANNSLKAIAIAKAFGSPFGVGNSYFRIGSESVRQVDTVPFGCYQKNVFEKIGLFDVELTRDQDDEFNARLRKNHGLIFLIPDIKIGYFARDTYSKVYKMFYQYGFFKPLVSKKIGKLTSIRQIMPAAFVLMWLFIPILAFWFKPLVYIDLGLLSIYLLINIVYSLKISFISRMNRLFLYLILIFFIMHIGYGLGYILGIIKICGFNLSKSNSFKLNH